MKVALIVLALAAVVAADSYGKSGYGGGYGGYKTDYAHPAHYNFDWRVKDDYYYNNYGQYESRYGYNTKGNLDTVYTGYDSKPAGHQKIDYVVEAHPVQVQSYGGYGHGSSYDNKGSYGYSNKGSYGHGGYSNKGYKASY